MSQPGGSIKVGDVFNGRIVISVKGGRITYAPIYTLDEDTFLTGAGSRRDNIFSAAYIYSESNLCPRCEQRSIADDDYLCKECRYG